VRFYDGNTDGDLTGGAAEGDSVLYYTTDANFSVTALVDAASGAVVERYAYTPYGAVSVLTGARDDEGNATTEWQSRAATLFDNQVLYSGYRLDSVTGLYHTDAREYDAYLGRFVQVDPMGLAAGPNVYAYCDGWPTGATDPTGLEPDWGKVERGIWGIFQGATEFYAYMPATSISTGNVVMMGKGLGDFALGINKTIEGLRGVAGPGASESVVGAGVDLASKVITGEVSQDARDISTLLDSAFSFGASGFARGAGRNSGPNAYRTTFTPTRGGAGPVRVGQAGEAVTAKMYGARNTESFLVNGRNRIPDHVLAQDINTRMPTSIVEAKNVQYQSLTQQLRDYVGLVGRGGRVDVALPPGARVSGPLQRAFNNPRNPLNRIDLIVP